MGIIEKIFGHKPIDGFEIVCPYCFHKFNGNKVHFRSTNDSDKPVFDKQFDENYIKHFGARGNAMKKPAIEDVDESKIVYAEKEIDGRKYSVAVSYKQNDGRNTGIRLCPHCHNELGDIGKSGPNKVVSVLGYTQIGKTYFITSLISYLRNVAHKIGPSKMNITFLNGRDLYESNYDKFMLNKIEASAKDYIEPIVLQIMFGSKEVFISFYDFPGEAERDFVQGNKGKHISNADAYVLLFDSTKTATFWEACKRLQLKRIEEELNVISRESRIRTVIESFVKDVTNSYFNGDFRFANEGSNHAIKEVSEQLKKKSFEWENLEFDIDYRKEEFVNKSLRNSSSADSVTDDEKIIAVVEVLKKIRNYTNKVIDESANELTLIEINDTQSSASSNSFDFALFGNEDESPAKEKDEVIFIKKDKFISDVQDLLPELDKRYETQRNRELESLYEFAEIVFNYCKTYFAKINKNAERLQIARNDLILDLTSQSLSSHSQHNGGKRIPYKMFDEWLADPFLSSVGEGRVDKPTAFVGTKSDDIYEVIREKDTTGDEFFKTFQEILMRDPETSTSSYFNAREATTIDQIVRGILFDPHKSSSVMTTGEDTNLRTLISNRFNDRKFAYFLVSAMGTSHETEVDGFTRPRAVPSPKRIAEPLFWVLHELGIID